MRTPKHLATVMAITMVAGSVAPVMAATTSSETIIGNDRHETAVKISKEGWKSAETVILVNSSAIPDALTATPLAHAKKAPILLTGKDGLNKATANEIKRLGAKDVIMIGGDAVLPAKIENDLKALKVKTDRVKGSTREETALAIAKRLDGIKDVSEIAVVNGTTGLADAVSVAAAAAEKGMPILLANPKKGLSVAEKFIKDEAIKASFVIGGKTVLPEKLVSSLPGKQRIEGLDRKDTNAKVIEKFYTGKELNNVYLAKDGMGDSGQLIDALAVGALAAKNGAPVLIASKKLSEKQIDVINTKKIDTIIQVGGKGNEGAFNQLKDIEETDVYEVGTVEELKEALEKANANDKIVLKPNATITEDIIINTDKNVDIKVEGTVTGKVEITAPNGNVTDNSTSKPSTGGGGVTQNPTVNVTGVSITTDAIESTIAIGSKIQLNAVVSPSNATNKNITWTSSNDKIATVNSKGEVSVVGSGDVTITATANNGVMKDYTFTAKESIKDIIEGAEDGTTIKLNNGTYKVGKIEIDKSIEIIGQSKKDTVVNGSFEVNKSNTIENIKISNMTITNPSQHINLTSNSNVANIEVSDNIFIHTNSSTTTSGGSNSAPGTIYFYRNKDISKSTNESTSLKVLNNTFEYPNAVVGDKTFVGQVMDTDEVVFSNNVIDVNEGGDIRKGFELTGNYKGASTFTAEGNTFNNTSLPIGAWLYENNEKSTFNINNNKFNNSKTECIWINPASEEDSGGNVLGTLNAEGNIANNDVPVILISNGVEVLKGSEEGQYVSSDKFFENAGTATSGIYNVNGEVIVNKGFASDANVTYRGGTFDFTKTNQVNAYNSNIRFENSKIKCSNENYTGIVHANQLTYDNCEIEGQYFAFAKNTKFINCKFNIDSPEFYNIWTYGSNVRFENCIFVSEGKSVLVYNEGIVTNVDLINCEFIAKQDTKQKAAIEISGFGQNGKNGKKTVTITNCKQTGFDTKGLWYVKNSSNKPVVIVDGKEQSYPVANE